MREIGERKRSGHSRILRSRTSRAISHSKKYQKKCYTETVRRLRSRITGVRTAAWGCFNLPLSEQAPNQGPKAIPAPEFWKEQRRTKAVGAQLKRGRGKLPKEILAAQQTAVPVKRGRGRPSMKKKIGLAKEIPQAQSRAHFPNKRLQSLKNRSVDSQAAIVSQQKRRGRPSKGKISLSKPRKVAKSLSLPRGHKLSTEASTSQSSRRVKRRGRPPKIPCPVQQETSTSQVGISELDMLLRAQSPGEFHYDPEAFETLRALSPIIVHSAEEEAQINRALIFPRIIQRAYDLPPIEFNFEEDDDPARAFYHPEEEDLSYICNRDGSCITVIFPPGKVIFDGLVDVEKIKDVILRPRGVMVLCSWKNNFETLTFLQHMPERYFASLMPYVVEGWKRTMAENRSFKMRDSHYESVVAEAKSSQKKLLDELVALRFEMERKKEEDAQKERELVWLRKKRKEYVDENTQLKKKGKEYLDKITRLTKELAKLMARQS